MGTSIRRSAYKAFTYAPLRDNIAYDTCTREQQRIKVLRLSNGREPFTAKS